MPNITIYDAGNAPSRFRFSLFNERITIGRSADCDIVVDSESVSGKHAVLQRVGNAYQLCRLDPASGMQKNGASDRFEFTKNCEVTVGGLTMKVSFSDEELTILQPQAKKKSVATPSQTPQRTQIQGQQTRGQVQQTPSQVTPAFRVNPRKPAARRSRKGSKIFNGLNLVAVVVLIGIGGAIFLNQSGYFGATPTEVSLNDTQDQADEPKISSVVNTEPHESENTNVSPASVRPEPKHPKTMRPETVVPKTAVLTAARSRTFASSIDPSAPPESLRVRLQHSGENRTLVLDKMQTRRDDYQLLLVEADGSSRQLESGIERNYSGYCEEESDSLVAAYLHPDGSLTANVLKAEQIAGTGAKTDWEVDASKEFDLLTDAAIPPSGKALEGASWVDSNPRQHPMYNDNYVYDLGFEYQSPYMKNFSEHSDKGYQQIRFRSDYSNAMFSLVCTRDLLIETKLAKIVIRNDSFDWVGIYKDWFERFKDTPIDKVAFMNGENGSGGYGFQKHGHHRHDFKISQNGGWMPWLVFRHETGHYLGVGDMAGGAREGPTIVNGNQFARWSMPALKAVVEIDRPKHLANEKDKEIMVSIGAAQIQVPPYAYADEAYIAQGSTHELDVLENDFDANGQRLALAGYDDTSASGGTIKWKKATDRRRDALEYTAPRNFIGLDRFSYSIVDETGRVAHGNVLIHINKPGLQAHWDFENLSNERDVPSKGEGKVIANQANPEPQFSWTQTEIIETREWDVSKVFNKPVEHNVTLTYAGGESAFIIAGCILELNGKVVSRDIHLGSAGYPHVTKNNVYKLKLKRKLKPTDKLLLKAKIKLGKNRENISSNGKVLIQAPFEPSPGKIGAGLELNGKELLGVPAWRLNSKSITIAAWVKAKSWKGGTWGPRIIQMAGRGQAWRLNAEHGKMAFCIGDMATKKWETEGLLTTKPPAENKWVHIAAVSDGLSMKIYYDGKLVAEKQRVGPVEDSASSGMIGSGFNGTIDELYVFNKPLTQAEIRELVQKGLR